MRAICSYRTRRDHGAGTDQNTREVLGEARRVAKYNYALRQVFNCVRLCALIKHVEYASFGQSERVLYQLFYKGKWSARRTKEVHYLCIGCFGSLSLQRCQPLTCGIPSNHTIVDKVSLLSAEVNTNLSTHLKRFNWKHP